MCAKFSKSTQFFANFTIGMIGKETRHLLKSVKFYRKLININKTQYVLRRNIAATSLKISCKNLYSVKSYDETNMKVFALCLWENFSWGLTYFDEYKFELGNKTTISKRSVQQSNDRCCG